MIAILEWTQSNEQQNIEQLQTPTMQGRRRRCGRSGYGRTTFLPEMV